MNTRIRSTAVVLQNELLLTFIGIDPLSKKEYYFLPGGLIEEHETAPESAERETLEETGYMINIEPSSVIDKEYDFFWNGKNHHCLTFFYRGFLKSPLQAPKEVKDADYNLVVKWIPKSEIANLLNYNSTILEATLKLCNWKI